MWLTTAVIRIGQCSYDKATETLTIYTSEPRPVLRCSVTSSTFTLKGPKGDSPLGVCNDTTKSRTLRKNLQTIRNIFQKSSGLSLFVEHLVLSKCFLTDSTLFKLGIASLRSLILSQNNIGPLGMISLSQSTSLFQHVECINLSRTRLCGHYIFRNKLTGIYDSSGLLSLLQALSSFLNLRSLDISSNYIGDDEQVQSAVESFLRSSESIQALNISGNLFTSTELSSLIKCTNSLSRDISLCGDVYLPSTHLSYRDGNLTSSDGILIAHAITLSRSLNWCHLDLSNNPLFGQGGLQHLLPSLSRPLPFSLTLQRIGLTDDDMTTLKDALLDPSYQITYLDISNNQNNELTSVGFDRIITGLGGNRTLTSLNLDGTIPPGSSPMKLALITRHQDV